LNFIRSWFVVHGRWRITESTRLIATVPSLLVFLFLRQKAKLELSGQLFLQWICFLKLKFLFRSNLKTAKRAIFFRVGRFIRKRVAFDKMNGTSRSPTHCYWLLNSVTSLEIPIILLVKVYIRLAQNWLV